MSELTENFILYSTEGDSIKVLSLIGEGGQGKVYKVEYKNKPYALKWYWKGKESEEFYNNLKHNVNLRSPNEYFLWPIAITERDEKNCFGYVMEFRKNDYYEFSKFLTAQVKFSSFEAIINTALQLTTSFLQLHARGQSYQDLNDGNFFINPNSGDILICDNDNVAPDKKNLGIKGKAGYMAPEILNRGMDNKPDKYSDRFSLAVILFLLFFRDHPLKGVREDPDDPFGENEYEIMSQNPIFIFDDKDKSNRPRPCYQNAPKFWKIYPPFIRNAFRKAFSKELMCNNGDNKEDRISESEWCKTITWLRRSIIVCPKCKSETFFPMKNQEHNCMVCKQLIHRPSVLIIKNKNKNTDIVLPLQINKCIYQYDIEEVEYNSNTINNKVGVVVENKKEKGKFGIKNLSAFIWYRKTPSGTEKVCDPGDGILIAKNNLIRFGTKCEAKIE